LWEYTDFVVRKVGGIASILVYTGFVVRKVGDIASILGVYRLCGENGR